MNYKLFLTIFCVLFIASTKLEAQIRLPSFFSDHMVLQQRSMVNIWGWARSGTDLKIIPSWSQDTVIVRVDGNSRWAAKIQTPVAGGPYKIEICNLGEHRWIQDVLIGEVWLCAGQSNMQWSAEDGSKQMQEELSKTASPNIRILQVSRIASSTAQDNIFDSWHLPSDTDILKTFSAIGYFMAKDLEQNLQVPIGIINCSWGGTAAEFWMPPSVLEADDKITKDLPVYKPAPTKPHEYGTLWNTMIRPLVGYNLAGVCWYQGENNIGSWKIYSRLLENLVHSWRGAWAEDFPFLFVQIAPFDYKSNPNIQRAALLREQQSAILSLPKVGMVVTSDLVDDITNIHPQQKREVALRLSQLALGDVYQRDIKDYKSPVYKRHYLQGRNMVIEFDYLTDGLYTTGDFIQDLFIAGDDHHFKPATSSIQGNRLLVFHSDIAQPKAVRFGFTDISTPNLFNRKGLPVAPFRTDRW